MRENFSIGQIVVCVDASSRHIGYISPPLIKGKTYEVLGRMWCPACDRPFVDVGLSSGIHKRQLCSCDHVIPLEAGRWMCASDRFRSIDPLVDQLSELETQVARKHLVEQ